jgi:hypothetical protein
MRKRISLALVSLSIVLMPLIAFAKDAPPQAEDQGSSPEPLAWALLLAGAIPALYVAYRARVQDRQLVAE